MRSILNHRFALNLSALCALSTAACDTAGTPADDVAEVGGALRVTTRRPLDPAQVALDALRTSSRIPADVRVVDGYPRSVAGRWPSDVRDPVDAARRFLATYANLYRAEGGDITLQVRRLLPSGAGVVFFQTWRGLPLFGALPGNPDILYGYGFSGNGIGMTYLGGRLLM